jgi:PPOX class probable F420-dependent enzyme
MTESIPEAAYHLFDDTNFAHVVTLMPDGSPQSTPVWVTREDGVPVINTQKGRVKYENLARDPRVALSIHNKRTPDQPYEWIQVRGRAEMHDDTDNAHINMLSRKYTGHDYRYIRPGVERVIVRIVPEKITHSGRS